MKCHRESVDLSKVPADAIVIGKFSDKPFSSTIDRLGAGNARALRKLADEGEITGACGNLVSLLAPAKVKAGQILVTGLGPRNEFDARIAFQACAAAAKKLAGKPRVNVVFAVSSGWGTGEVEAGVAGAFAGCRGQDLYRARKRLHLFEEMTWDGSRQGAAAKRGAILGEAIGLTRRLANEPASTLTPGVFAEETRKVAEESGMAVEVWDEQRLREENCGAFLAVSQGSVNEACLVRLTYDGRKGRSRSGPDLSLVGKGVTFDSGGLSIKPKESMIPMKFDMSGAATVLGAMRAIAALKLPIRVEAWMGMVENMIGEAAYRPGDIVTARNGKTIEIHSTDAEGRLVLADVLTVAAESRPRRVIDLATLTGSCVVALGWEASGAMTNDDTWCAEVLKAADGSGERLWQLPMYPEYETLIEGDIGDLRNVGKNWGRAGASVGGKFLAHFIGDIPWVHIDMASVFSQKPKPWLDAGATGTMVRTLVNVARGL